MNARKLTWVLMVAGAIVPAGIAQAEDFRCRNTGAEIRCADGVCNAVVTGSDDGFTPMELTRSGNRLQLCAYSGCWNGQIEVRHTRRHLSLLYATLDDDDRSPIAVIYNRHTNSAQLDFKGFANPMGCAFSRFEEDLPLTGQGAISR